MRVLELIGSIYIWLIALFIGRRDQIQNHIENNNNQQNNNNQNNQQQQQQQQITINVDQSTSTLNNNNNNNNTSSSSSNQIVNAYKNIDKKEPISYKVYKKKALDYLKKNETIDTDSVIANIVQQCQVSPSSNSSSTSSSDESTINLFSNILGQSIENERFKYLIVNAVFDYMKKTQTQTGEQWLSFLSIIFSTSIQTDRERQDISDILLYLPPAVLGDIQDRSKSRVLVDIFADMSDALSIDRRKLGEISGFVEEVSTILITLLTSVKDDDSGTTQFQLLALLLLNLNNTYRSKLLLSNLVMSRILPLQINSRQLFLNNLFSFKGKFQTQINNQNNQNNEDQLSTSTTTTTTSTSTSTSTTTTTTNNMV
ncbi:hypothetical protein DFA_08967 [Cavenderia fasciculata]|uniref:Uncharacterized protein n=1 Tax=Cavenderia fasciculata TaxID=261658 RepID=F4Q6B9_CACFS|nr:uncharacterized protein DFA_08967 [Cavenderia fasciculata]EGG16429.1 hypothetical protein DFA_08967 [Cavenderia fasciculata]|eukprot:XP_004354829.1 hypothetical protein DFA_08967 [Cavenderia fasciculata]